MKFRNTLIALIVLIGLGMYVRYYDQGESKQEIKAKEKFLVIIAPDSTAHNAENDAAQNAVTHLELIYKNSSIACSKDKDNNWLLTSQDLQTKGDNDIMAKLIADLKDLKSTRMITENIGPWDNYGLDNPEIKLIVTQKEKSPVTIYFGNKNPTQTAVYARVLEKETLYLIPFWKKNNFKKTLFELREKSDLKE